MATFCTRCQGTGFLNFDQLPEDYNDDDHDIIIEWINSTHGHDVSVCDCCGDTEYWYGVPGEHYNPEDLPGPNGPYSYNGGLCECH